MERKVSITEEGRSGDVVYAEGPRSIRGWWEFAGGDALAIVNMGSATEWTHGHPWAVERRAEILRQRSGLGQWPVCGRYYRG